jgi:hypothetical protein
MVDIFWGGTWGEISPSDTWIKPYMKYWSSYQPITKQSVNGHVRVGPGSILRIWHGINLHTLLYKADEPSLKCHVISPWHRMEI